MMSSNERVVRAIRFQDPDRPPISHAILPSAQYTYGEKLSQIINSLGRTSLMRVRKWTYSYSTPPSISDLKGAQLADEPYIPERRTIGLKAETSRIELTLTPEKVCVNPVIEIAGWSDKKIDVWINNDRLVPEDFAWDGSVLWINKTFYKTTHLRIDISDK